MKKNLIIILLCITASSYSQSFNYPSYGLEMPVYNTEIEHIDSKMTIEKLDGEEYSIVAYDKKNTVRVASITVKFNHEMSETEKYEYNGTAKVNGKDYNCIVITNTKLSSFAAGDYSGDVFDKNDYICILYGERILNFYPLKK